METVTNELTNQPTEIVFAKPEFYFCKYLGSALPIFQISDDKGTYQCHTGTKECWVDYFSDPDFQYYYRNGILEHLIDVVSGNTVYPTVSKSGKPHPYMYIKRGPPLTDEKLLLH